MHCKVTIDMLNPTTRVKEQQTVVQYGEITDIYKYLSNWGSPIVQEAADVYRTLSPDVCAGGLVCFEEPYSDNLYFDCRNKLTAYGTKIDANTTLPSVTLNSKIGMKLTSETVLEPGHYSRTWEFGTTQGNGTIKSIALTHQGAAHAFDSNANIDTYSPDSVEAMYSMLGSFRATESDYNASNTNLISTNTSTLKDYIVHSVNYSFYTSENFVFYIYKGAAVDDGDYTNITFYVRKLPKRCLDYYPSSVDGNYNRVSLNPNSLAADAAYDFTRVLRIPKAYYDSVALYSQMDSTSQFFARSDCSYLAFFAAKMTTDHYSDEPSLYSNQKYTQFTFYVFSGDNCEVTEYHMDKGCAALTGTSAPGHTISQSPFIITSNKKLIYWMASSSVSNYGVIYCRDISTGNLLWTQFISRTGHSTFFFAMPYNTPDLLSVGYTFSRKQAGSTSTVTTIRAYCIDTNTGNIVGTTIHPNVQTSVSLNALSNFSFMTPNVLYQDKNCPLIMACSASQGLIYARINYMLARVNLTSPIVKTSDYIMQVKFEMFID